MKKVIILLGAVLLLFSACKSTTVKRIDADRQTDLSGYWNDTDVKIVCDSLIDDCLKSARVTQAMMTKGKTPVVMVGRFKNDSSEHIDTNIISSIMEMSIFNSGRLDFVSSGDVRDELRAERLDQQEHASPQTMARLRNETGADYLMTGSVRSIVDREGNQTVRRYYVTAELTDIETNQRLWIAQNSEIKKLIRVRNNTL